MDPRANVFEAALSWLNGTLLGTVASTAAVIAVAAFGFLTLSGRIDMRRGARVILGCFVIFGASTIAGGLVRALGEAGPGQEVAVAQAPPPSYPAAAGLQAGASAPGFDPYAGASLPPNR